MYERIQGNDMYNAGPNIPFSSSVTFSNGILLANPSTSVQSGTTLIAPITVADITGLNRTEYKLPVSYQYSTGVQQAFGAKSVLSVSYVGNQSRHQNDYRETNLPDQSSCRQLLLVLRVATTHWSRSSASTPSSNRKPYKTRTTTRYRLSSVADDP